MSRGPAAAALLLIAAVAADRVQAQDEPEGFPDPGPTLVDDDFRVSTREFGLDRRVEMYQWQATDGGYERVWHAARIDSSRFARGHENPAKLPLENQRWWAQSPMLDGKPLDPDVLRSLGEWRVMHPNFSRLPANLAAAFQPEGDGLGSAENPLDPHIGDLRVSWRELVLPSLNGRVELRGGVWRLAATPENNSAVPASPPIVPQSDHGRRLWPFLGGGFVVVAIAVALRRRRAARKEQRPD